jgi:hypothetical protein
MHDPRLSSKVCAPSEKETPQRNKHARIEDEFNDHLKITVRQIHSALLVVQETPDCNPHLNCSVSGLRLSHRRLRQELHFTRQMQVFFSQVLSDGVNCDLKKVPFSIKYSFV